MNKSVIINQVNELHESVRPLVSQRSLVTKLTGLGPGPQWGRLFTGLQVGCHSACPREPRLVSMGSWGQCAPSYWQSGVQQTWWYLHTVESGHAPQLYLLHTSIEVSPGLGLVRARVEGIEWGRARGVSRYGSTDKRAHSQPLWLMVCLLAVGTDGRGGARWAGQHCCHHKGGV